MIFPRGLSTAPHAPSLARVRPCPHRLPAWGQALANLAHVLRAFNLEGAGTCYDAFTLPTYGVTFMPTLLRPRSRGRVSLRSADSFTYPDIQVRPPWPGPHHRCSPP